MSTAQMLAGQKPLPPASIASHTPGLQANSGGIQPTPSISQVTSSNVSTLTSNTKPAVLQQQQQPLPIQPLPVSQQNTISLPQQPSTTGQAGQLPNLQTTMANVQGQNLTNQNINVIFVKQTLHFISNDA